MFSARKREEKKLCPPKNKETVFETRIVRKWATQPMTGIAANRITNELSLIYSTCACKGYVCPVKIAYIQGLDWSLGQEARAVLGSVAGYSVCCYLNMEGVARVVCEAQKV